MSDTELNKKQIAQEKVVGLVKGVAKVAGATQKGLGYFIIVGALATVYCIFLSYSPESAIWWNVVKGVLIVWPVLLLGFLWMVLGDLKDAPDSVGKLNQDTKIAFSGLKEVKAQESKGIRGTLSVLNQFRREGSLGDVFDTVGSITLIVNPFFLFLIFLSLVVLALLSFTALLIVIF